MIQINPVFHDIILECMKELTIKFPDYGNSWLQVTDKKVWLKRIKNEIAEYEMSMSKPSDSRKLINIINLCSMAWSQTK